MEVKDSVAVVSVCKTDVTDPASVQAAVDKTVDDLGAVTMTAR